MELTKSEAQTVQWMMHDWLLKHPDASIEQYNRKLRRVVNEIKRGE